MTKSFRAGRLSIGRLVGCLAGCLGAALLGAAAPVAAQDEPDSAIATETSDDDQSFARDGLYFGIGGGGSVAHGEAGPSGNSEDGKGGFFARIGRRFHPHAAAEVQVEIAQANLTTPTDSGDTVKLVATANLRIPILTGRIQPFLLAGIGVIHVKNEFDTAGTVTDDFNAVLRMGGGVAVYVTRSIALTVDTTFVQPTGNLSSSQFVSILGAVQFRF